MKLSGLHRTKNLKLTGQTMLKFVMSSFFIGLSHLAFSQEKVNVYLFPGQGSDERIFSGIMLDKNYELIPIRYPEPGKNISMAQYAHILARQIDTTHKYIFIGVSVGGMLCTELADLMKPQRVIIISSASCRKELPMLYRLQRTIPVNKIVPGRIIKSAAKILQPVVEPDRKRNKAVFKSMLQSKSPEFYRETTNMIVNWDRTACSGNIIHIHGTNDHTLPIRNVRADHKVIKGSHMMTLTRCDEINKLLHAILDQK